MKAVLIGAGTIGSRHLQGLARSNRLTEVVVVDPLPAAQDAARIRWAEVAESNGKVLRFGTLDDLRHEAPADFVLVSTTSAGRLPLLENVLATKARRILLEKVLFQSVADYRRALAAVEAAGADVRANLVYRMVPFFQQIRAKVNGRAYQFRLDNGDRGFGCNAIHFIDLFEYIGGSAVTSLSLRIDKPVSATSRAGNYVDFSGHGEAVSSTGGTAELHFVAGTKALPKVTITWPEGSAVADYNTDTGRSTDPDVAQALLFMPMASQIAHVQMDEILSGTSPLPTLRDCFHSNALMLTEFNRELGNPDGEDAVCAIT